MYARKTIKPSRVLLREAAYDNVSYVCPTWNQMGEYTFSLSKKILDSGDSFDRIVALAKGVDLGKNSNGLSRN